MILEWSAIACILADLLMLYSNVLHIPVDSTVVLNVLLRSKTEFVYICLVETFFFVVSL